MSESSDELRVHVLLDEALALAPEARAAFVASACADAPTLRDRLRALLLLALRDDGFLDHPRSAPVNASSPTPSDFALQDTEIGPYRLLRRLGIGGMGEVWLGERTTADFRQHVAIKLVRKDSEASSARFHSERDILAALEHPGIARLFDGGVTPDGRPYMVMEYVQGEELLVWCTRHGADLRTRLELFLQVCDAVAYAHGQLVVHRDLKPGNVLVTGQGNTKLLDFGIAKLLNPEAAMEATRTAHLSPAYAAPEQLSGDRIGTATDVHALGATLYQLLTENLPWPIEGLPLGLAVERLLHDEPALPSRRVADGGPVASRALRGDLDAIVRKALRREPQARYPDARALADDVRRHLELQPVHARSGARAYVARRFLRRNWIAMSATIGLLLALTVAAVYANLARTRAEQALRQADAVRSFVVDLFEENSPERRGGKVLSTRELVDLGARRVQTGLDGDADTRIELLGVVARLYASLGEFARAGELEAQRLQQARAHYAVTDPRLVMTELDAARLAIHREDFDAAQAMIDRIFANLPPEAARDTATAPLRVRALSLLSSLHSRQGRFVDALQTIEQAAQLSARTPGIAPEERAELLADLGIGAFEAGRNQQAEAPLRQAIALLQGSASSSALPALISAQTSLGKVLLGLGRFQESRQVLESAAAGIRRIYGDSHPWLADTTFELAHVAMKSGDSAAAIEGLNQALKLYVQEFGAEHSFVASTWQTLGQALKGAGRNQEAIDAFQRARQIYLKTLGPTHAYTLISQNSLATTRLDAGDLTGAEAEFRAVIVAYANGDEGKHIYAEAARMGLGRTLTAMGRYGEAEIELRGARDRLSTAFGAGDYRVVQATTALADCLARAGRRDAAREVLDETERALSGTNTDVQRQRDSLAAARKAVDGD